MAGSFQQGKDGQATGTCEKRQAKKEGLTGTNLVCTVSTMRQNKRDWQVSVSAKVPALVRRCLEELAQQQSVTLSQVLRWATLSYIEQHRKRR